MSGAGSVLVALLIAGLVISPGAAAEPDFFAPPAVDRGAGLPHDEVFPRGRLFPFGGFSGVAAREAANGFTLHGPAYGASNATVIPQAEASGIHAIYSVGIPMNFLEQGGQPALDLTPEEIAAEIRRQVLAVRDSPALAWWYLTPEELRPWRPREMEYLEVAARTIRENDPLGRPVWMYDPNHRAADTLAVTAQFLDIVGKGMYTNYAGHKGHRVWARWTIEQQIEAIQRSGRPGAIQIAVPEMFQEPEPGEIEQIPKWARHDVYLALVTGAQGVVIFSLANRAGFSAEAWQAYYDAYSRIAQELNGELALGQVFLFGERRNDLQVTVTAGEKHVFPKVGAGGVAELIEYPSVSLANIAYGPERYLFLVNSSEEPVEVRVDGFPPGPIYARDAFSGRPLPAISSSLELALPGLGVAGLRLARGYVWLASPDPGQRLDRAAVPVVIETPGISARHVAVELDGTPLYAGEGLPQELRLRAAELEAGEHRIALTVLDERGQEHQAAFEFAVEHFRLSEPDLPWGQRIRGELPLSFALTVAPDEVRDAFIRLKSIRQGSEGETTVLYAGSALPESFLLDTLRVPDGAYDLEVGITTTAGVRSLLSSRVVIANWVTLEDAILPPTASGWFGPQDRLRTVDRSEGWEFSISDPDAFFGDGDRIRPAPDAAAFLTWRLRNLSDFTFTVYAREANVAERVRIALSEDGAVWRDVPFALEEDAVSPAGWRRVRLSGTAPAGTAWSFVRFTLAGSSDEDGEIELGHAFIRGRTE